MKPGDVVVDLGAAPGGWLQVAGEAVGRSGYVLGVDLKPITPPQSNVETLIGDVNDPSLIDHIKERLPRAADVVLCDLSPSISGVWEVDQARQVELVRSSLRIARSVLRPGGTFFTKVFQGDMLDDLIKDLKKVFRKVRRVKPTASKPKSAELYLLCTS
jgi:23S rRNA (uridine2552-2'-O)-methyltransferase